MGAGSLIRHIHPSSSDAITRKNKPLSERSKIRHRGSRGGLAWTGHRTHRGLSPLVSRNQKCARWVVFLESTFLSPCSLAFYPMERLTILCGIYPKCGVHRSPTVTAQDTKYTPEYLTHLNGVPRVQFECKSRQQGALIDSSITVTRRKRSTASYQARTSTMIACCRATLRAV